MKVGKRIKRLTKLRIHEVSAVDRGAAVGARVLLMKRADGKKRRVAGFNDAGEMIDANGVPRWRWKKEDGVANVDAVQRAKREIEANNRFAAGLSPAVPVAKLEDHSVETHVDVTKAAAVAVIKRFEDAVDALAARYSIGRPAALLKASSSPETAALWRDYRQAQQVIAVTQPAPVAAPAPVMTGPAVLKMNARVAEILKSDPKIQSVESAIAKVASSPLMTDQVLWRDYKTGGVGAATVPVDKAMSGKEMARIAFQNLCGAVQASYPDLSVEQVRAWASRIQRKGPPKAALQQLTVDAA